MKIKAVYFWFGEYWQRKVVVWDVFVYRESLRPHHSTIHKPISSTASSYSTLGFRHGIGWLQQSLTTIKLTYIGNVHMIIGW